MINKRQKKEKGMTLLFLFMIMGTLAVLTPKNTLISENANAEIDVIEGFGDSPESAALISELTGPASSIGLQGYTNGTYANDFDHADTWTDQGVDQYSPTYTVTAPTADAEHPWVVDSNRVDVTGVRDKTNYVPDSDFSDGLLHWDTDTHVGGFGTSVIDSAGNEGEIRLAQRVITSNIANYDLFPDHYIANGAYADHYSQSGDGDHNPGDDWSTGFSQYTATNQFEYWMQLDSYVDDADSVQGGGEDGGNCNAISSVSMNDGWDITYTTEANLVNPTEFQKAIASLDFEIKFDDAYSDTTESVSRSGNQGAEGTAADVTVMQTVEVQFYIVDSTNDASPVLASPFTRTFTRNWGLHSTQNYAAANAPINISTKFDDDNQYKLRLTVRLDLDNDFYGTSRDYRTCSGHCDVTCNSAITAQNDNRLKVWVENIDFTYKDYYTVQNDNLTVNVDTNDMDFQGRGVEASFAQVLTFDFEVDDDVRGIIENSKVGAWLQIDGGTWYYELTTFGLLNLKGGVRQFSWTITNDVPWQTLNTANFINLQVGVFMSGLNLDWTSGTTPYVYIRNVQLTLEGKPNLDDVNLRIGMAGELAQTFTNGAQPGDGWVDLDTWNINLELETIQPYFITTAESLIIDFEHSLKLSFEAWGADNSELYSTYECKNTGVTNFKLNFSITTPYGNPTNFIKAYQNNFYFNMTIPRYIYNTEPYWDVKSAWLTGWDKRALTGEENVSNIAMQSEIFVNEWDTTTPKGNGPDDTMQVCTVFWDSISPCLNPNTATNLDVDVLFEAPNMMSGILISNDTDIFGATEPGVFIAAQDDLIIRGILPVAADKGNVSVRALTPSEASIIGTWTNGDVTGWTQFDNIGSAIDLPNTLSSGIEHIAYAGYTGIDVTGFSSGDRCIGTYEVGYKSKYFEIKRETVVEGPDITIEGQARNVFDTTKDGGLIQIKVKFSDDNGGGAPIAITNATAVIGIGEFDNYGTEGNKKSNIYTDYDWSEQTPMLNLGGGEYAVWVNPLRDATGAEAGNMSWGYHNFTVTLSKDGFLPKTVKGNFSIMIDTYLEWVNPPHITSGSPPPSWPHLMESTPMGEKIMFSLRMLANETGEDKAITNNTGLYKGKVFMTYQLINSTNNLINWSAIETFISPENNPTNGTFEFNLFSGSYDAYVMWPTIDQMSKGDYIEGVIVEYNVSVYVERNTTETYEFKSPYWVLTKDFQPDHLESPYCENESSPGFDPISSIYINPNYLVHEETLRIELVRKEAVNETVFRLINDPSDNHNGHNAFSMGTFDNETDEEGPEFDNQEYKITNYYYNESAQWFVLRGLHNCSGILLDTNSDPAPPCGPLNESNIFYGEIMDWAGNTTAELLGDITLNLTADTNYLWTAEVNHTLAFGGAGTPIVASGVTWVTDPIWFNSLSAGTYSCHIHVRKSGFYLYTIPIVIEVLAQNTTIYNATGDEIDLSINPVEITVPRWNSTSFIFHWNDTTNLNPVDITNIDSIEITDDDNKNAFKNGTGTESDYWTWENLGGGDYRITILDTNFAPSTDPINLQFKVNKGNYSSSEFKLELTVRQRNIAVDLVYNKNDGNCIFTDSDYLSEPGYNPSQYYALLSYEILDLDNSSTPVYISDADLTNPDKFNLGLLFNGFSTKVRVNDASTNFRWRYNMTIVTLRDVGDYDINLTITGLMNYYNPPVNEEASITIVNVTTNMTLKGSSAFFKEFLHYGQTREDNLLPRFEFVYWDEDHVFPLNFNEVILNGNWTNGWNNVENAIAPGTANEDIKLIAVDSKGNGTIYIDIQMNNSQVDMYYAQVTLTKPNYETVVIILNFTITNKTAQIKDNQLYYGIRYYLDTASIKLNGLTTSYAENVFLNWTWGSKARFKFTYTSGSLYLNNDTANGMPIVAEFQGLHGDLVSQIIGRDTDPTHGSGEWSFQLDLTQITGSGVVPIVFNISIWSVNFDKVIFGVNISIHNRIALSRDYPTGITKDVVDWTEDAQFDIEILDKEVFLASGTSGTPYWVENPAFNGTQAPPWGDGNSTYLTTNWTLEVKGSPNLYYRVVINTTLLDASATEYTIIFNVTKPHYNDLMVTYTFRVNPVDFEVEVDFEPGRSFVPEFQKTMTILVSLKVHIYGADCAIVDGLAKVIDLGLDVPVNGITITYVVQDNTSKTVVSGTLTWNNAEQKYSATFDTVIDGEGMLGIYEVILNISSTSPNYIATIETIEIVSLGTTAGDIPAWFWPLLMAVIGAAVGMAGYGVKKALYLRIPFVLRKIDETMKKIEKGKFPAVGVMTGRDEFIINSVIGYLELCGIEWEREDKFEIKKVGEGAAKEKLPAFKIDELGAELAKIPEISAEERSLFIEELTRLDRTAQEEFLNSLRGDMKKDLK